MLRQNLPNLVKTDRLHIRVVLTAGMLVVAYLDAKIAAPASMFVNLLWLWEL